jgi:hypothetical protein
MVASTKLTESPALMVIVDGTKALLVLLLLIIQTFAKPAIEKRKSKTTRVNFFIKMNFQVISCTKVGNKPEIPTFNR